MIETSRARQILAAIEGLKEDYLRRKETDRLTFIYLKEFPEKIQELGKELTAEISSIAASDGGNEVDKASIISEITFVWAKVVEWLQVEQVTMILIGFSLKIEEIQKERRV